MHCLPGSRKLAAWTWCRLKSRRYALCTRHNHRAALVTGGAGAWRVVHFRPAVLTCKCSGIGANT